MKKTMNKLLKFVLVLVMAFAQLQLVSINAAESDNLALNKPVEYSGVEGGKPDGSNWKYPQFVGEKAVDGDTSTRWSADKTDSQWLIVDLGKEYNLDKIKIDFHAESPEYEIQIAREDKQFEAIASVTDGSQGNTVTKTFDALGQSARYVKYQQNKMWKHSSNGQYYGSSIIDLSVTEKVAIDTKDDTIRIGTFNIAANKKPDVNALRALTEEYKLEVVGLQEVDVFTGRNNYDMLTTFAGETYPSTYFSKAIDHDGGEYGIGTASKYLLEESKTVQVDSTGADEQRVYQRSLLTKGGRTIAFYNTHLSWESWSIRSKQFEELKTALQNETAEYIIVTGDFNADQQHSEFNTFLEEVDMVNGYQGKWHDTFNGVDATMKVNSVDNILLSRNLEIEDITMVETNLSDHNLLTAELKFLDEKRVSNEWLRATLEEAESYDSKAYTKESFAALQSVITKAKEVFEADVTQAEVNKTVQNLKDAIASLEVYNLALNAKVTVSGTEVNDGRFTGPMAVDGIISKDSRWSAEKIDEQWLLVDLGDVYDISEVMIYFESECPDYEVQVSIDGETFTTVYKDEDASQGDTVTKQISFEKQPARYVKYVQHQRWQHTNGNKYSTSIYEFEVYREFNIETVKINNVNDVISIGETFKLNTTITPDNAKHKPLIYTSSNDQVISINENGLVTALSEGTATLTVASKDNPDIKDEVTIRVVNGDIKVLEFRFDASEITLTPRDVRFLEYTVYPTNAVNPDLEVKWSSSNENVATVDQNGKVTCQGIGETVITVTSVEDENVKGQITIKVTNPNYNSQYDLMHDRWLRRVIGEDLDLNDKNIAAYVNNIDKEGQELWAKLNKNADRTTLWTKLESDTVSADYTTQITKIKKLALAFGVEGTSLYQNPELLNDILNAIEFMVINKKYNGSYSTGNWWDWQIGCTQPLVDILMIVSDFSDDPIIATAIKSIEGYAKKPSIQWPSYTATGANRTDIGLSVLGSAILAKSDERMNLVKNEVPDVMKLVTSGDGLYKDGSVIQHTKHAYTGSYGNELLKGVGKITSIISGTDFEIVDPRIQNVYETVLNGYIPLMHKGQMMSMVNGRSISRAPGTNPFTTEFAAGSETISNIMLLADGAGDKYESLFKQAVKYWLEQSQDYYDFFTNARDFDALLGAKEIMDNDKIKAVSYTGMKVYGSMDRVVQANKDYTAGLSMYSSRIYNYEFGNTENKKGWHTGSGVLYIYNNDLEQYGEGYWPTVDPYRLPGTTVDTRKLADGAGYNKLSPQSWVGGTTNGENGTAAMYYNASNLGLGMDLKAEKSWFFLDGKIVNLGANITGTSTASIETTIENRMMTSEANKISINGQVWDKDKESLTLSNGDYVHFTGTGEGNDLGYYFIQDANVDITKETRTGRYEDINSYFVNDETYEKTYFKMGINHGKTADGDSYQYIILPGVSEKELAEFAANNTIQVVQNDADVQAIKETSSGIFAMNVWSMDPVTVNGITVEGTDASAGNSASVFTQIKDGIMTINVSDPKQKNVPLKITLEHGYVNVLDKDDTVTVNEDGSFTINTAKSAGATHTIVVKLNVQNKTALQAAVDTANAVSQETLDKLIPVVVTEFKAALQEANEILANPNADQATVDASFNRLSRVIHMLEFFKGDKTELKALIDSTAEYEKENYTAESWSVFSEALNEANIVFNDENALEYEVVDALNNLKDAIANLEVVKVVDKSLLQALYEKAAGLDKTKYTEATIANLDEAMLKAKTVLDNEKATQQEVDNAYVELLKAYLDLRLIPNKDILEDLINQANRLNKASYTVETWKEFANILNEANKVLNDPKASEEEIKNAENALTKAMDKLVLKSGDTGVTGSVNTGDDTNIAVLSISIMMLSASVYFLSKKKKIRAK